MDDVSKTIEKIMIESWDDEEDDDVARADRELRRMKAKPIEADKKTDPDKEIGKLAKKTPKEVDEGVKVKVSTNKPIGYRISDIGAGKKEHNVKTDKEWDKQQSKKGTNEESENIQELSKDTLQSYVNKRQWDMGANEKEQKKMDTGLSRAETKLKGNQHKLDVAEPKGKLTGADFKKLRKENSEQINELSKRTLANYMKANSKRMSDPKNPDSMERKMKRHDDYFKASKKFHEDAELSEKTLTPAESKKKEEIVKSMKKGVSGFKERYGKRAKEVMYATATKQAKKVAEEIVNEAQGPTSTYDSDSNLVLPANTTSSPALNRAKDLARGAMKRLNNNVLGKSQSTSEESEHN